MIDTKCLLFTGFNPEIEEYPQILLQLGFQPLSLATPANLPAGALVVLYNIKTFSFETIFVRELENGIFFYTHQTGRSIDSWNNALLGDLACNDYLFKVMF